MKHEVTMGNICSSNNNNKVVKFEMSRWPQVLILLREARNLPEIWHVFSRRAKKEGPGLIYLDNFSSIEIRYPLRCSLLFFLLFCRYWRPNHQNVLIIKTYFPFPRLILTMGSGSVFKQGKLNLCKKNMDLLSRRNRRRSWWTYCSRSLPLILCLMHPSLFYLPTRYHTQIIWLKLLILWCALVKFPLNWPGVKRGAGRQITKTWTEIPWDRGE